MANEQKPYAYVAFKGDTWHGSCDPATADDWTNKLLAAGCSVKPVFSKAEYDAEMEKLK
jgi:hypothetical protein